ncbi:MAG: type II toxin-antitoxin system Phd/YefM family antitoxin [Desulfobacula sp.]|uniref:type II toxin-antitoxin system Phd/YefM family antitoxin n=1 Tax=Desulfobacula sp. TaxID=2593537 RepID=UPI0025BB1565|nr:type II toxin-antitoxin system Phd/YefM family antitoxin [Desulfobacula sp.]MCD4719339.1 type II toxin-antitoxin system Phd/YefM family antitoxin [Desulfobacula sp.]
MKTKFSEDIVPISDLKVNPGRIIKQVQEAHRPVLLTNRGRGVAVVQALHDYESDVEKRTFMKAVLKGIVDLEEGRELSLADVKKHLRIK